MIILRFNRDASVLKAFKLNVSGRQLERKCWFKKKANDGVNIPRSQPVFSENYQWHLIIVHPKIHMLVLTEVLKLLSLDRDILVADLVNNGILSIWVQCLTNPE